MSALNERRLRSYNAHSLWHWYTAQLDDGIIVRLAVCIYTLDWLFSRFLPRAPSTARIDLQASTFRQISHLSTRLWRRSLPFRYLWICLFFPSSYTWVQRMREWRVTTGRQLSGTGSLQTMQSSFFLFLSFLQAQRDYRRRCKKCIFLLHWTEENDSGYLVVAKEKKSSDMYIYGSYFICGPVNTWNSPCSLRVTFYTQCRRKLQMLHGSNWTFHGKICY